MTVSNIKIGDRVIGAGRPTYMIAEVGSNHNGSIETATELIRLCASAGADAVKFQAYERATLFAERLPAAPDSAAEENQKLLSKRWSLLPKTSVPDSWWPELMRACRDSGVQFLCTPFDIERLARLTELGMRAVKIASGDITWLELLRAAGATGVPVIFSTGASDLEEVRTALAAIRQGGGRDVAALHCVSNYPPKWEDANLKAIETLREEFALPVGLSDHTPGSVLAVAAVTLGACIVEKHVTIDRSQEGLDHHFAMEIDEFARLVEDIRHVEAALGTGAKKWAQGEEVERYWVRRGLWCGRSVSQGETITREMVSVVRPSHGLGADRLDETLDRVAKRDHAAGEPLTHDSLL